MSVLLSCLTQAKRSGKRCVRKKEGDGKERGREGGREGSNPA